MSSTAPSPQPDRPARHAIVTGGSDGIGLAVAHRLAGAGFALTLIARRPEPLAAAQAALAGKGADVGTAICDVADGAALAAAIATAETARGPCHTLVTAAGTVRPGRFEALSDEEFRRQMDVNYFGTVAAVRAVYPGMAARGSGRIAMISSAAALIGIYGYTAYAGSKFAVRGFAEALRGEARTRGITVTLCYPGDTETAQYAEEMSSRPPETAAIAGKAALAHPDHVAAALLRALDRGTFVVYPGLKVSLLGWTASFIAPVLHTSFDRVVRRLGGR